MMPPVDVRSRTVSTAIRERAWGMIAVLLLAACAPSAFAQVPRIVSHHGVLTDGSGTPVPDGEYDLTFRLYGSPTGGAVLFAETHTKVPVAGGRFGVILGASTPLDLAFDAPYWASVQVGGGPEQTPRLPLTAAPYALSLALPFRGSATGPATAMSISGGSAGLYVPGVVAESEMTVDGATDSKAVSGGYDTGTTDRSYLWIERDAQTRVGLDYIEGGSDYASMLQGRTADASFTALVGFSLGSTERFLELASPSGLMRFGLDDVLLPPGSVQAAEVVAEPGISSGDLGGASVALGSSSAPAVLGATTFSAPAGGYALLTGTAEIVLDHTSGFTSYCALTIQTSPTSPADVVFLQLPGAAPSGIYRIPATIHRTLSASAGPTTFYLIAYACSGSGCSGANFAEDSALSSLFVPTAYGFVEGP